VGSGAPGESTAAAHSKQDSGCKDVADLAERGGLLHTVQNDPAFTRLEGPEGKAAWDELWLRAFAPEDEIGNWKLETGDSKLENGPVSNFQFPVSDVSRQRNFLFEYSRKEILEMADITWERIQMLLEKQRREKAQVKQALEAQIAARREIADCRLPIDDCSEASVAGGPSSVAGEEPEVCASGAVDKDDACSSSTMGSRPRTMDSSGNRQSAIPGDRPSPIENRQLALAVLVGALGVYQCLMAVVEAAKEIQGVYVRMLVSLYGNLERFEALKPESTAEQREARARREQEEAFDRIMGQTIGMQGGPIALGKAREMKWRGGGP